MAFWRYPMIPSEQPDSVSEEPVVDETLVEEVSIDGMCGVY
jgi:mycofactocin precursor